MSAEPTVFVVDDDADVRDSLRRLMESARLPVVTYASADAFLEGYDAARPACLILDIRMRGMSGLALQEKLSRDNVQLPIIILSAHGDVAKAVQAMKAGAVDFITKPYKGTVLLERVREALRRDTERRQRAAERTDVADRLARLSPREREVFDHTVRGASPKEIALALGLSRKTVDIHRSHVFAKLQVDSIVELVRLAHSATPPDEPAAT